MKLQANAPASDLEHRNHRTGSDEFASTNASFKVAAG